MINSQVLSPHNGRKRSAAATKGSGVSSIEIMDTAANSKKYSASVLPII